MKDGFKVIDADRHILEPTDLYQNYLPEKFKHRVRLAGPNQTVREVDGKPVSNVASFRDALSKADPKKGILLYLDRKGSRTFAVLKAGG